MSNETKDAKHSGLAEKVRPTQCAYVMQPPTLKCQPSLHNKRFNDQEMIMYLNDRYEGVLKAKASKQHTIYTHQSNGPVIKKNPIPFSDVLNKGYEDFNKSNYA